MHVIPKGSYKKFRLRKDNILPGTKEQHEQQSNGRYKDEWPAERVREWDELYDSLRAEYNRLPVK